MNSIKDFFRIKRLYKYTLQTFLPIFAMTFAVCLFIVLLQFVWKYIDDFVGKGLEISVIAEFLFYALLTLIPIALPLSILLASLMTFGNLGERLELLAIKSSGISLLKMMRALLILIIFITIGAFLFQDRIIPKIQSKHYSLLYSIRIKSPALDIPEGAFYGEIEGYNLYIEKKDKETNMLYEVTLYDVSGGVNRMVVTLSDSAKLAMSEDKKKLVFTMHNGQQFSNFEGELVPKDKSSEFVPYARETFKRKQVVIPFDANFERMPDDTYANNANTNYLAKDSKQLKTAIDSILTVVHDLDSTDIKKIQTTTFFSDLSSYNNEQKDSLAIISNEINNGIINIDSIYNSKTFTEKLNIVRSAISRAETNYTNFHFNRLSKQQTLRVLNRNRIELLKKYSTSLACLIFFLIGAPLGSIIRKGGMGMPVVTSVLIFIVYYIFDTGGYKMARDYVIDYRLGMWLSSMIFLPVGIFLMYKAMNDSPILNADIYIRQLKRIQYRVMKVLRLRK